MRLHCVQKNNLFNMTKGWFIGNFEPSVYKTDQFEVAVKLYSAGDKEAKHVHKIATEITVIIAGTVLMCGGKLFIPGQIITLEPGEPSEFEALTDAIVLTVKVPCVKGDKYDA